MLTQSLIKHCAPTLAGLKTASLFSCPFTQPKELGRAVTAYNRELRPAGVAITILKQSATFALIYVYRPTYLAKDLAPAEVQKFLAPYGYQQHSITSALALLRARCRNAEPFPHEIGLFLGYPLADVVGFIQNGGKNCKCAGYWKVYHNEKEALQRFAQFRQCRDIYWRCFCQGKSLQQLTVVA